MPIDASIYGQIAQPQTPNLLAQFAQAAQVQGVQQQNKLAQLQMDEYARKRAQEDELRAAVRLAGNNPEKIGQAYLSQGDVGGYTAFQKGQADLSKTKTDAEAAAFKLQHDKLNAVSNIISGAKDQTSYENGIRQLQAMGLDTSTIPAQFDPVYVSSAGQQALTQKERLEAEARQRGLDLTARGQDITRQNNIDSNATSRANNAASVNATIRGQNMTDSRSREANAIGRVPTGYRQNADGTLSFIPGGPADPQNKAGGGKPLTEGQSKSLVYASRMQEANDTFDKLSAQGTNRAPIGSSLPGVGGAITALSGANDQRIVQAQRDFVNAVLRRESGAAISPSEFDSAQRQYFPQLGDSQAVIAQKKRNREIATRGIAADVPDAENRINQVRGGSSGSAGGWSVTEVK